MNKIILSSQDVLYILRWRDEHKDLVRRGVTPLKAVKFTFPDAACAFTAIREGDQIRCTVNREGKSIGHITYRLQADGMCRLLQDTTGLSDEDRQGVLTVYMSTMALFVFGNTAPPEQEEPAREPIHAEHREKHPRKAHRRDGCTYVLTRRGDTPAMQVKHTHRSPEGTFSVRGHYRHYKNGRVIWIAEFTKGTGGKKKRTYKLGQSRARQADCAT